MAKTPDPADEIYTALGRALSTWSMVEQQFCRTYLFLILPDRKAKTGLATATFWAIESFWARLNMVDAAMKLRFRHDAKMMSLGPRLQCGAQEEQFPRCLGTRNSHGLELSPKQERALSRLGDLLRPVKMQNDEFGDDQDDHVRTTVQTRSKARKSTKRQADQGSNTIIQPV